MAEAEMAAEAMSVPSSPQTRAVRVRVVVVATVVTLNIFDYPVGWVIDLARQVLYIGPLYRGLVYLLALYAARVLIAAVLLTRWGWWRRAGWRAPAWHRIWLLWLPLAFLAYDYVTLVIRWNVFSGYSPGPHGVVSYTATAVITVLAIGATEEIWFRGLLLEALRPRGARSAVVISAALFGAWHLGFTPRYFVPSVSHAVAAFGIGLIWGAARLRIGSIWPLVLIHAAADFPAFLFPFATGASSSHGIYPWKVASTYVVVGLVYALVLTRRSRTEIVDLQDKGGALTDEEVAAAKAKLLG